MKNKVYLAINLKDFHQNQEGASTTTQIIFIESNSLENAKRYILENAGHGWSVFPKSYLDKNIIR